MFVESLYLGLPVLIFLYCVDQISADQREGGRKCYVTFTKMQTASLRQTVAEAQCCDFSKSVKMRREEGTQTSKQKR